MNRLLSATAAFALMTALGAPALAQTPAAPAAAAPAAPMAKPVAVNGDLLDTLKLNGQFTAFTGGIDATNLGGLLKTNKNLTVFAPTDAAFAPCRPADLAKLKSDKAAMQKFLLHHIDQRADPSSKIKGAKGRSPAAAGQHPARRQRRGRRAEGRRRARSSRPTCRPAAACCTWSTRADRRPGRRDQAAAAARPARPRRRRAANNRRRRREPTPA
jgi:hypothetical protein